MQSFFRASFLVTPCHVVTVYPCMEWIPLKKKISNLKPQVSFYLKFASLFDAIGDKSSVLFWLKLYLIFNLIIFSAKVQNFRLSTVQVKFHQICTLIGYFCWSYIKFQLKKHGGVMSHDIREWYKIWIVTDFFFQKWHEFDEFWSEHWKA